MQQNYVNISITIVSKIAIKAFGYVMSSMINPDYGCIWSYATKWTIEYGDDINNMTILETKETNKLEDRGVYKIFPTKEFIFKVTFGWYGFSQL